MRRCALVLAVCALAACEAPPNAAVPARGDAGRPTDSETPQPDAGPATVDAGPDAEQGAPDRGPEPPAEAARRRLFGAEAVIPIEIELGEDAYARLAEAPRSYVSGSVVVDGVRRDRVGIRLKGSASFKPLRSKAAFKIELDHEVAGQRLFGLRQLVLNNMVQDHSKLRERLASTAFARLGVPAPRVGYAEVRVNGELYGLYTNVEALDEVFLERVAPGDGGGVLYEGDFDIDLWRADIGDFDRDAGADEGRAGLERLVAGLDRALPLTFDLDVGSVVDLDAMRAFFAAEMVVGHWDGYASQRNNYFVYLRPSDGRAVFFPWGTDQTFSRTRDALVGRSRLLRMCAAWLPCRLPYAEVVERFALAQAEHDTAGEVEALRALIDPVLAADPKNPTTDEARAGALEQLLTFVEEHPDRLLRALTCLDPAADLDGDLTLGCAGDCDEADPAIYPGAAERCGDEVDQDCSEVTDDGQDCPPCRLVDGPGGSRFLLCHGEASYSQPEEVCATFGTLQASVRDADEQGALTTLAMGRWVNDWWLGLRVSGDEVTWMDGSPVTYTNWAPGEPEGGGGCVVLGRGNGLWREVHCGLRFPVLCRLVGR